ncbi:hypothetical protein ACFLXT_02690 [Chloroflexota bacterium]
MVKENGKWGIAISITVLAAILIYGLFSVYYNPQNGAPVVISKPDVREIKTAFISYTQNEIPPSNDTLLKDRVVSWQPSVPVNITGWQMSSFITTLGDLSNGFVYVTIEPSIDANRNTPGRLGQLESRLGYRNGTIYGEGVRVETVMLPPYHYIRLDANDPLYIHFFARNTMDSAHLGSVGLLIYYSER